MTKFALVSDLHGVLPVFGPDTKDTVLLLPGDLHETAKGLQYRGMIDTLCSAFRAVILVPGNHEYYGSNIESTHRKLSEMDAEIPNFHFLQSNSVQIDDVLCIGSTLWTSMDNNNPMTKFDAGRMMNDYRYIRTGPPGHGWKRKLNVEDTMMFHKQGSDYITKTINANTVDSTVSTEYTPSKVLVLSHHAPSFMSVSPEYRSSSLNGAYCSDLDQMILDLKPDVWVHGHVHTSHDYQIDGTRVLCNPQGYELKTGDFENKAFNKDFTFVL